MSEEPDPVVVASGTCLVISAAIQMMEKLRDLSTSAPTDAQALLAYSWQLVKKNQFAMMRGLPSNQVNVMVAFTVIDRYFLRMGNWSEMIRDARVALVAAKESLAQAKAAKANATPG